ncbi:MAG: hypothetical protein JXR25_08235 [Pontiellaceae bacterium]|nr:hypothetical protein [Pontiellaceae bacterium]MBN2784801.1 hypothetical protein [Pontiellaceae bacterium]
MKRWVSFFCGCRALAALVVCAGMVNSAAAQQGAVRSIQKDKTGVTVQFASGILRLNVCDNGTLRVRYVDGDKLPEKKELVVIQKWKTFPFAFDEKTDKAVLR